MAIVCEARPNGRRNQLQSHDRSVHEWYRFVLSFPPHLVRDYLERFGATRKSLVLDPFCGTGTTLVECKKNGFPSVGVEANPMAAFASKVKVSWEISSEGLARDARRKSNQTLERLLSEGISDSPPQTISRSQAPRLTSLPAVEAGLLLKDSISPIPLHKSLRLLEVLNARRTPYSDHEILALASALVHDISNLHFGPEVGIGSVREDAPVISSWRNRVEGMVMDLRDLASFRNVSSRVIHSDARSLKGKMEPRSVDIVITSPPYPNEKDYTRTTRLESVLLGFIRTKQELRAMKQSLMRSNTRNVYVGDDDDKHVSGFPRIAEISRRIEERRLELGKDSGFERLYHRVAKLYFGGMTRHLSDLREVLKPGANLAYVVGDQASYLRIMIRTGSLIAEIAESLGYKVEGIDLFRTRLATATREQLREEVVVLSWPGK